MKGCLKLILSAIFSAILGIAVVGFIFCGGINYVQNMINSYINPTEADIQAKTKEIGDFSKIPKTYKITKAVNMMGVSAVVAEDNKTNQQLALVDSGKLVNITKDDIRSGAVETQLKNAASNLNYIPVKLAKLEVGKKGFFKAMDQSIPYIKVKMGIKGQVNREYEGIIGVASTPDKKNKLVVSMNEPGKYKQDIAEKFFKNIKLHGSENNW